MTLGTAAHAVAPEVHAALSQRCLCADRVLGSIPIPVMRDAGRALINVVSSGSPDHALILWIVDTVSHAVIHSGVIERPGDLASGRLGEELMRLLLAYLQTPRSSAD